MQGRAGCGEHFSYRGWMSRVSFFLSKYPNRSSGIEVEHVANYTSRLKFEMAVGAILTVKQWRYMHLQVTGPYCLCGSVIM